MIKKLLSLLLAFCLLVSLPGTCSAMYQISEQELTALEQNLMQLKQINSQLLTDLTISKEDLTQVREKLEKSETELTNLQNQLIQLRNESNLAKQNLLQAQNSLNLANESLQKYEKEAKSEKSRLTWQRNLFAGTAVFLVLRK